MRLLRRSRLNGAMLAVCLIAAGVCLATHPGVRAQPALSPDPRSGEVECTSSLTERHNPHLASGESNVICFEGYLSKFGPWHDEGVANGLAAWGIPQWTIHRVDAVPPGKQVPEGRKRPRSWFSIPKLQTEGVAPADANYKFSKRFRDGHPNWYERGHLTQKYLAERLPGQAGWFTHNVVNAVPQRARFNKGPWLTLECYTGAWANENGSVWIITGPIFLRDRPADWLESDSARSRFAIAVPDAIFKIVARKTDTGDWDALGFLYPQDDRSYVKGPWSPAKWLTSIDRIERLTGEKFSPDLKPRAGRRDQPGHLWLAHRRSFDPSCKRFAKEVE